MEMRPLQSFRERITGPRVPITRLEVEKVIVGLSPGRAPGPDGPPAALFRGLPALRDMLALLLDAVIRLGRLPVGLTQTSMAP